MSISDNTEYGIEIADLTINEYYTIEVYSTVHKYEWERFSSYCVVHINDIRSLILLHQLFHVHIYQQYFAM